MSIKKSDEGLYEVEINGSIYAFEKWGADESLDVLLDIVPLVGKPLGTAVAAVVGAEGEGSLLDKKFDPNMVSLVFESLTSNFNKKTVKDLVIRLCSHNVLCDGKKIVFRIHYQDQLGLIFKVAKAALEVQYGNFFDALLEALPITKAASPGLSNRKTHSSDGSSGDQ